MKKLLEYKDQMITDFANLYAETFTAEEMKAVADFYRSGAGAKFIAKTPELMKKGAAIGMKYSQKIADEMKAVKPPPRTEIASHQISRFMANFDYDLFVIGAGSGGVRAARIAASHGARVAIAEEYRVGGTCVIRGCVPKKLLVYASRFADEFEDAAGFGWTLEAPRFDWPSLIAAKDKEIARLEAAYRATLAKFNVELLRRTRDACRPQRGSA